MTPEDIVALLRKEAAAVRVAKADIICARHEIGIHEQRIAEEREEIEQCERNITKARAEMRRLTNVLARALGSSAGEDT